MKKTVSILLSCLSVICIAFAFGGCGDKQEGEQTEDVQGKFYNLITAYSNGWIDDYDLRSIACNYYEWRNFEENPYSGQFNSTEELSEKTQQELIEKFDSTAEDVVLFNYFGTYEGNIAVALGYEHIDYESFEARDCRVGEIVFPDFRYLIKIYHSPEQRDPNVKIKGKLYDLQSAFKKGLIDESGLKSISCFFYDRNATVKNPYAGLYSEPTERLSREKKNELKQAFLKQIDEDPDGELDQVIIHEYLGTYNGNVAVSMTGYRCRYPNNSDEIDIGGVRFCPTGWTSVYIYHC